MTNIARWLFHISMIILLAICVTICIVFILINWPDDILHRNNAMLWTGVAFGFLIPFVLISWMIFGLWIHGHNYEHSCMFNVRLKHVIIHAVYLQCGLASMMVGAICKSQGTEILSNIGIAFLSLWAVIWLVWFLHTIELYG